MTSRLTLGVWTLPAASLGKLNPLPDLENSGDLHARMEIDRGTISEQEARYMGWGVIDSILPYQIQDGYHRHRRKRDFQAAILESDCLRATFLLELGGRLWSLYDKTNKKELLHVNPAFQPCNLALRNAWFSGGVEWNCGVIGHTPFTAEDMAAEQLAFLDGTPVLRMYQYERIRHLFYRIEAFLPEGVPFLMVRIRIDNALNQDTAVYWWSNMAVNETDDLRVIVPADQAFRECYGEPVSKVPVPKMNERSEEAGWDASRPATIGKAMDFFYDLPKGERPFIAAVNREGEGIVQTSTPLLMGRKMFVWGECEGGRHWQQFLSRRGSRYIELQSGLAKTQLEHLPMVGGGSLSWLEAYGSLHADGPSAQSEDWKKAKKAVQHLLNSRLPADVMEKWHEKAKKELDGVPGQPIHQGMGFARCEQALRKRAFSTVGLSLQAMTVGKAERPWMMLAKEGTFPCPSPEEAPVSYQIDEAWERMLRQAMARKKENDHWYAHYQLGVMLAHRGQWTEAEAEFRISCEQAVNSWSLRCLSLCAEKRGDKGQAVDLIVKAAEMKPLRPLVIEALKAMSERGQYEEIVRCIGKLPAALQKDGRVLTFLALSCMRSGRLEQAREILEGPIVLTDVREGDVLLTELWFEMESIRRFGQADEENIAWMKEHAVPPRRLDFRVNK